MSSRPDVTTPDPYPVPGWDPRPRPSTVGSGPPAGLRTGRSSPALLGTLMGCLVRTCCGSPGHQAGADPPGSSLRAAARRSPPEPSRAARSRAQAEHSWLRISGRTPDRAAPRPSWAFSRADWCQLQRDHPATRPARILRAAPSGPPREDLPRSPPGPPDPGPRLSTVGSGSPAGLRTGRSSPALLGVIMGCLVPAAAGPPGHTDSAGSSGQLPPGRSMKISPEALPGRQIQGVQPAVKKDNHTMK